MILIAINLTVIAFIVLPVAAAILGVTVYFFLKSRKSLQETLEASNKTIGVSPKKERPVPVKRGNLVELEEQFARKRFEAAVPKKQEPELPLRKHPAKDEHTVHDLKNTIAQQQRMLDDYLQKVEELEQEGRKELNSRIGELETQVDELHEVIEKKEADMKELQQEAAAAQRLAGKIEEVYQEFEQLQIKMTALEKQASRANAMAIELEDTRFSYEQIHKELTRKQEKLEEVMTDNQRMRQAMNELEDKLSEANLQRQQLQKKVLFLTDLNSDMQGISDTNKKLQTELRRIGELESMLNMMAEERDFLLRKKKDR